MDYVPVTEVPGNRITREAARALYSRYHHATRLVHGRGVLEVGCGSGQGLGYLARSAQRVVGLDYTHSLLQMARNYYRGRIPLLRGDGQALPFRNGSFDVVLLYEAVYYLPEPKRFVAECWRVLRPGGVLLLCTANKDWRGFIPSPYSVQYFSPPELTALMEPDFEVALYGMIPVREDGLRSRLSSSLSLVRRVTSRLRLIPKTMKGKERLKRLFYGELVEVKPEIEPETSEPFPLEPVPSDSTTRAFKVVFVVAHRR
jgi:SAM-dependent methyltransferase